MPGLKRLQRYIFVDVLASSLAAVAVFVFVLLAGNALRDVAGMLLEGRLTLGAFLVLLGLLLPYVTSYALPIGLLCGILISLGRLSGHQEITAMRASGQSLLALGTPVLLLALMGTAASVAVHSFYGPEMRDQYRNLLSRYVRENPLTFLQAQTFIDEFPGYVFYIGNREGAELRDVWIWELDEEKRAKRMLRADSGRVYFDAAASSLILELTQGRGEIRRGDDPEAMATEEIVEAYFDAFPIRLSIENILARAAPGRSLERMELTELLDEWRLADVRAGENQTPEAYRMEVQVQFQENVAFGYAVLSLALVAFPLAIRTGRRETHANMGLALVLALGYYVATISVSWVAEFPELRPDLLVWMPNLVFQSLGIWLILRMDRV